MKLRQVVLLLICLLAGCRSGEQSKPVYSTTGRVMYNQQPLVGAKVMLYPIDRIMLPRETPVGVTDGEGKFTLSTYGTNDGAPTGYYRVGIVPADLQMEGSFPLTYVDPLRSGLKAQINSTATTLTTFELSGPALAK